MQNWPSVIQNKLISRAALAPLAAQWRANGEKIVFTNGVFDILHLGHVEYLAQAASLGTKCIIGLNSDSSVKALNKGPERPINPEEAREKVLASLAFIDAVIIFSEPTPLQLISEIKPHVLVKGGDYNPNETDPKAKTYIVGSDIVKNLNGEVITINLVDGFSTTNIVTKLRLT
ncbi:MAG: adenylyltransferase/cytidyltransferase family protein [Luteibaculaceae bacterium]